MTAPQIRIDEKALCDQLFPQLQEETKIYNSFQHILAKMQAEGNLLPIYTLLNSIFDAEKKFTLKRDVNRNQTAEEGRLH
jgi:hypothetical protein